MRRRRRNHDDAGSTASDASEQMDEWGMSSGLGGGRVYRTTSMGSMGSATSEAESSGGESSNASIGNSSRSGGGGGSSSTMRSSKSSSSSRKRRKPSGSFGSRGDMLDDGAISKAKQAQLDRELRTVDTVIKDMAAMALTVEESILYVMTNSVDVQRIATLQQMSKHVDSEDGATKAIRFRLLLHLLVNISGYTPAVQVACAGGIEDMLPMLEADVQQAVYTHTKRVMFAVDASAFSAWYTLFFAVIRHVSQDTLRGDLFEFLEAMTDQRMTEKERRFGCKLIAAITQTDASLAWRLLATVQKLALDPLPSVRKSLTESLWPVLEALPRVSVREECIANPLSKLLLDTNMDVSTATFKVLVQLLTVMDEGFVAAFLFPVLLKYTINAPPSAQDVVYASFGRVVYYSRKSFTRAEYEDVLAVYKRMCRNANEQCRKHCASNFLAMCATFNQQPTLLPKVLELLTSFVTDSSVAVRRSVAAGYHELFGLVLANVPTAANGGGGAGGQVDYGLLSGSSVADIALGASGGGGGAMMGIASAGAAAAGGASSSGWGLVSGVHGALALLAVAENDDNSLSLVSQIKMVQANALQLMDDTDLVVRERLFNHVGIYLRSFSEMYRGDVAERRRVLDTVIPPLIKFEQAITTNWRKLSQLLKYFDTFPKYFSFDRLERDLVPILVSHLVNGAVALKRKIAVTIATFLRTCGTRDEAERTSKAIHTLVRSLLHSSSSQHRIAYIILVEGMTAVFSSAFVGMYLYTPLCRLRDDAVPSVRSHLATALPCLLAIPSLKGRVEADLVPALLRDSDAVVVGKARRARTDASLAEMLPNGGSFDAARDQTLTKQEAILLTREVFRAGLEEAHNSSSSALGGGVLMSPGGTSGGTGSAGYNSTSPTHANVSPSEENLRPRRRSRSPGRQR